jgi:ketosteroid isomerase-like protein
MKKLTMLIAGALIATTVFADHHEVEAQIRAAEEAFNGAYESNDYETYFGFYAEDATLFFYGERQDLTDYYDEWKAMIEAGGGVGKYEMSDMRIQVMPGGEVAIATYFIDGSSYTPDGESTALYAFETDVWQKIDGEWKVVSLHYTGIEPAE